MFQQLLRKYWTRLRNRKQSPAHRRRRFQADAARLMQLEPLEDRRVLATITVDSLLDNTTDDGFITLREAIVAANNDAIADATEGTDAGSGDPIISGS